MQLKTIFNCVTEYKPFVVEHVQLVEHESQSTIEISMRARENGLPTCSVCGERCSGYDTPATSRRFDFIPLWMIPVVLVYTMRRVNCPTCGVKVERVPWSEGKSPLTTEYKWFLAGWARRMSWKEVSECFQVSWDHVYNSVKHAAEARQMKEDGYEPLLTGSRWLLLKRPDEPERKASGKAKRTAAVQPEQCAQPPDERGFSDFMDLHVPGLGRQVS